MPGRKLILLLAGVAILICAGAAHAQQRQGWMGVIIQDIPPALSDRFRLSQGKGALVIDVVRGQPADKAGIKRGDAIVEVDGNKVENVTDLQRTISGLPVGKWVKVKVIREGGFHNFNVKLAPAGRPLRSRLGRSELLFWLMVMAIIIFLSYAYSLGRAVARRARRVREVAERPRRRWPRPSPRSAVMVIGGVLLLTTLFTSFKIISPGSRGVVFNMFTGLKDEVLGEGLHVLAPLVNKVHVYNIRTQTYTMVKEPRKDRALNETGLLWAPTVNGLKVGLEMTIRYKPDPGRLTELHRDVGPNYADKVVKPSVRNMARLVVSGYDIEEIYNVRRLEIQREIKDNLGGMLASDGILLEDVLVRDVVYSQEFEEAVERKMMAAQKVTELSYQVEQAGKRAEAMVKEAQGEAEAFSRVSGQISRNPGILTYMWINELQDGIPLLVVPNRE